jgi:hypothetical protein
MPQASRVIDAVKRVVHRGRAVSPGASAKGAS